MENEKRKAKPAVLVLFALFIVALLVLGWFTLLPNIQKADTYPVYGSENWMADVPDEQLLSELAIPGTHDSATQYVQLAYFSKCQSLSIGEQLNAGFRYLDIRLSPDGQELKLVHGFTNCRTGNALWSKKLYLSAVLQDCGEFLEKNPTECILFAVKKEDGNENISGFQKLLSDALLASDVPVLETSEIPTMGEARGKLVLFRRYEDELQIGAKAGIPLLWADQPKSGSDYVSPPYVDTENGGFVLRVQDRFEYNVNMKWDAFTETLRESASNGDVTLDFLSTKGPAKLGHPYRFAKKLNKKLLKEDFSKEAYGKLQGGAWIIVDFGSPKLAEKVWKLNFPEE